MNVSLGRCFVVALAVVCLAACGNGSDGNQGQPAVRVAVNPWLGSLLNATVAEILLEEQMGFAVEIVPVDENAQWELIAGGHLDASLEVWPSGHAGNIQRYIEEEGSVEDGGPLGPTGRIGWYVPSYVVQENPSLATWEGFTDPAVAASFTTPESSGHGQFVGGDPTFVQFDAEIIRNLGLDFQVVYAGSEDAILAALETAVEGHEPLLFYFWTPHPVHVRFELTRVALPPHSDECYAQANAGGVDCDYPEDRLLKILRPGLGQEAARVYEFLQSFNYSTEDQFEMIEAVEVGGKTAEEAAREWIDANEAVWGGWIDGSTIRSSDRTKDLRGDRKRHG